MSLSIYGITKELKARLAKMAIVKKWSLSKLVIDLLEKAMKGEK